VNLPSSKTTGGRSNLPVRKIDREAGAAGGEYPDRRSGSTQDNQGVPRLTLRVLTMPEEKNHSETTQLGDLVASVFEEACRLTSDPSRAAALAAAALRRILLSNGEARLVRLLATS
jgi:hypothetical protein